MTAWHRHHPLWTRPHYEIRRGCASLSGAPPGPMVGRDSVISDTFRMSPTRLKR